MHAAQQAPGVAAEVTVWQSEPVATPAPAPLPPTSEHVPASAHAPFFVATAEAGLSFPATAVAGLQLSDAFC